MNGAKPKRPRNKPSRPGKPAVWRVMIIDSAPFRKKTRAEYEKVVAALDRTRALIDEFHRKERPGYERWFLREGDASRPTLAESTRMVRRYFPELVPIYDQLVELAGGRDRQARLLSLWCPTPFFSGCSQLVWPAARPRLLVRNYDYAPAMCDAVFLHTRWDRRTVLVASDCLWGALDGINDDGLAVSLAYGGRTVVGAGFAIPLVLRYVLERCSVVAEATEVLARVPINMAYNVTVLDAEGAFATVVLAPDRAPEIRTQAIATNHQDEDAGGRTAHAGATRTYEREAFLAERLADDAEPEHRLIERFLEPPLYSTRWHAGNGTLYTAAYRPASKDVELRWPGQRMQLGCARFEDRELAVTYGPAAS